MANVIFAATILMVGYFFFQHFDVRQSQGAVTITYHASPYAPPGGVRPTTSNGGAGANQ